jgi:hypothetical protein
MVATVAEYAERRRRLDAMIDEGLGACLLRAPEFAAIVGDALLHFDAVRYRLIAGRDAEPRACADRAARWLPSG